MFTFLFLLRLSNQYSIFSIQNLLFFEIYFTKLYFHFIILFIVVINQFWRNYILFIDDVHSWIIIVPHTISGFTQKSLSLNSLSCSTPKTSSSAPFQSSAPRTVPRCDLHKWETSEISFLKHPNTTFLQPHWDFQINEPSQLHYICFIFSVVLIS